MKPNESVLPPGIKPLSSYAHGTQYVSSENRISRKTRPKTHRTRSDHLVSGLENKEEGR